MLIYGSCPKCGGETKDYCCADCLAGELRALKEQPRYLIVEVFEWTSHQNPPFLVSELTEELLSYLNDGQYGCYDTVERKWTWGTKGKWVPVEVKPKGGE